MRRFASFLFEVHSVSRTRVFLQSSLKTVRVDVTTSRQGRYSVFTEAKSSLFRYSRLIVDNVKDYLNRKERNENERQKKK